MSRLSIHTEATLDLIGSSRRALEAGDPWASTLASYLALQHALKAALARSGADLEDIEYAPPAELTQLASEWSLLPEESLRHLGSLLESLSRVYRLEHKPSMEEAEEALKAAEELLRKLLESS
ncbi:MAG: hypothetical protein DRN96_06495 [Thermoproteota archaeon]|nr:MAG: hypothetical protein DRN96_06495 [Candidatus Korarchaeota archaeon]RLG55871.1 MAG: hypothetical protein DRN99_01405 [Candidatus Korarchaeota archaeon]